ncbi:2-oxoglutarate dehydrogenase E2 component (dihydrolipoamide succinyltransferase) [Brevibacterium siliguriense]|uniref:2-oxoglutarate dehydrogenase E2 component (Dihydrolipoamide succinyltransferase) n=1 Tax=Brevibacterium siliguriense TaxID=1136497 RepID=A0A1H1QBK9_9MICO|nr:biotin/lipoyl-containing protein [Brevibacterium siliguriense]SDS20677.1 2-oxoglutarate dehydrogenase E2 component (dihydrolipoamide succinyltransferase) [Brevibacterium siliguriense]
MITEVTVADLGEGNEEGIFVDWLVDEGESVEAGEAVAEVMTDKVSSEVVAPVSGVLHEQRVSPDDTLTLGVVIGTIEVKR